MNDVGILSELVGTFDENLKILENELGVIATVDGLNIFIKGEPECVRLALETLGAMKTLCLAGETLQKGRVLYCLELAKDNRTDEVVGVGKDVVCITSKGKAVKCKTLGQKNYVSAIQKNDVVFGVGPAGTGKTYLAVGLAVQSFKQKKVDKIILTRPAVEAGERLGFLPGDLQMKVDPYLRPLYDALAEMLGQDNYLKLMERGVIEVAPLAYMRGRTLTNAFIILDEAQNTTKEQMKMFLTRMGEGSKIVVTGDVTQIDLPDGKQSGLKQAVELLKDVEGVKICTLTAKDVVRHPLVMRIIRAYEAYEEKKDKKSGDERNADDK